MIAPPRLATWLLECTLAAPERDAVLGDLREEFARFVVPARGLRRARWWYRWQVARSVAPLVVRTWERASLQRSTAAMLAAALIATVPAILLIALRTFVLQQVPLKTTSEMSLAFAAALLSIVLAATVGAVGVTILILKADSRDR